MKFITTLIMLLGLSFYASAEDELGPCQEDMIKFCKDVKRGEGRKLKCLKQHESELSQGCKDHRAANKEARQEARKEIRDACHDDMQKICPDRKPGDGERRKCFDDNKEKFSQACVDSIEKMKEARKARRK